MIMTFGESIALEIQFDLTIELLSRVKLAFERHLEEIHVTWAHLEKKRTRLRTNTKTFEHLCSQRLETASPVLHDAVTTHLVTVLQHFITASAHTDSQADLKYSTHDGVTIKMRHCRSDLSMDARSTDFAGNWLERLPTGSITTWEDLTTRFLAQFFPPRRTAKLRNDILIRTIYQSAGGKLRDLNAEESWALIEDLALYDNESWNDPRDFAKPVKAIALPQDVPSTSDRHLIEFKNQVQRLMEAYLASTQPTQVNKIITSCEICSGPHDTQYCMEVPEQAFVEYASSHTDEAGEGLVSNFMASQDARLSKFEADFKHQQSEMTNKINTMLKAIIDRITGTLPSDTVKNLKLSTFLVLSARSYPTINPQCSSHPSTSINAIKAHSKEANISQTSMAQTRMGIETQQPEEPEPTLEDEF
ncbi:MAK10-like protein [Tanacetum coccineum]